MTDLSPFCRIDSISSFCDFRATVDVLRLDLMHPVVSGNKWFKLKGYLADLGQKTVLTFGGPYSNHLVATAAATREIGLQSIGIVRGEKPSVLSPTLLQASSYGMNLFFSDRAAYRTKTIPAAVFECFHDDELCIIPEGGYGKKGAAGARDILRCHNTKSYTYVLSAVGTGTTLAGLAAAAEAQQKVVGISVLKNNRSLFEEIGQLVPDERKGHFQLEHDYHFGGYAKWNHQLIQFMNRLYTSTKLPTDFVYTGKALFAVFDLLEKGVFTSEDRILFIHTGGLQGNRSLPKGTLIFE